MKAAGGRFKYLPHSTFSLSFVALKVRGNLPQAQPPPTSAEFLAGRSQGHWFSAEEAKLANENAASARQRGKVANAVETALSLAAAQGGTMQLRPKRGRRGDMLTGLSGAREEEAARGHLGHRGVHD